MVCIYMRSSCCMGRGHVMLSVRCWNRIKRGWSVHGGSSRGLSAFSAAALLAGKWEVIEVYPCSVGYTIDLFTPKLSGNLPHHLWRCLGLKLAGFESCRSKVNCIFQQGTCVLGEY